MPDYALSATDRRTLSGIDLLWARPIPDPTTSAGVAAAHAAGALLTFKEQTGAIRQNAHLSDDGQRDAVAKSAATAYATLTKGDTALQRADGEAVTLERTWRAALGPQDATEAARFAEIRQHLASQGPDAIARLTSPMPDVRADAELWRAIIDGPRALGLLPNPDIRAALERQLGEQIAPRPYAAWAQLAHDLTIARDALASARSYLDTDTNLSEGQRASRHADEAHRQALLVANGVVA